MLSFVIFSIVYRPLRAVKAKMFVFTWTRVLSLKIAGFTKSVFSFLNKESFLRIYVMQGETIRKLEIGPGVVWYQLKGYRAFRVYGSDDGHLMEDLNTKGWVCLIDKGVSLYHPFQNDMAYCDWKRRACVGALTDKEKGGFFK